MRNKLSDLNNVLFEQLERLQDDSLGNEGLQKEIKRSHAVSNVAQNILEIADLSIQATKLKNEYRLDEKEMPELLEYGK